MSQNNFLLGSLIHSTVPASPTRPPNQSSSSWSLDNIYYFLSTTRRGGDRHLAGRRGILHVGKVGIGIGSCPDVSQGSGKDCKHGTHRFNSGPTTAAVDSSILNSTFALLWFPCRSSTLPEEVLQAIRIEGLNSQICDAGSGSNIRRSERTYEESWSLLLVIANHKSPVRMCLCDRYHILDEEGTER
jgi:hypothetical protein